MCTRVVSFPPYIAGRMVCGVMNIVCDVFSREIITTN